MPKTIKFKINGLHCESCKTLIESEVKELAGVKEAYVDYPTGLTKVAFEDSDSFLEQKIYNSIKKLGYKIESEQKDNNAIAKPKSKIFKGLILGLATVILIAGYFVIQRLGFYELFAQINQANLGYGIIFIIGLISGFHCIGMCGSLVVTYTAMDLQSDEIKPKKSFWPHLQYNLGRLISYTIIGGILGGIGSFFAINVAFTGIITIVAGLFMIVMGISLVTNWRILDKIKIRTPKFIARYIFSQKKNKQTPFIIGLLNGLMPCGPLQAMQLYALTSGSFITGALSLGIFALGTIPLMFGFGAFISYLSWQKVKQILKVSGILVVILGIFMIGRGLTNFNFNFQPRANTNSTNINANSEFQTVDMDLTSFGYEPSILTAQKGIPVRWVINVKEMTGCTNEIRIDAYKIYKKLNYGENIIEFTPTQAGEIKFSCGMGMVWGKFIIQ